MAERRRRLAAALIAAGLAVPLPAGAASRSPVVEDLGGGRYRITLSVRSDAQPIQHAQAVARLREEAHRVCEGRGRPVAQGELELGRTARGLMPISFVYACQP